MIIKGEEGQTACVHPPWPSEPWEEKGAGGRIQHTGNFPFINDISGIIEFHPKHKIKENTEYFKRMRVLQDISEYYRIIQSTWEYFRVLQVSTLYYKVLQSITDY